MFLVYSGLDKSAVNLGPSSYSLTLSKSHEALSSIFPSINWRGAIKNPPYLTTSLFSNEQSPVEAFSSCKSTVVVLLELEAGQ